MQGVAARAGFDADMRDETGGWLKSSGEVS